MKEQLEAIRKHALEAIAATREAAELESLRVKYLGKKGELTAVLKQMGTLSAELRPVMGQMANEVRANVEKMCIRDRSSPQKTPCHLLPLGRTHLTIYGTITLFLLSFLRTGSGTACRFQRSAAGR